MSKESFEWDSVKDLGNQAKHGVSFAEAQYAFADPGRVIAEDLSHSHSEKTVLLFRESWGRYFDCPFYISPWSYPNFRGWLLAQRQTNL